MSVRIIGAGLAGCEAAWQLVQAGIRVELHEMRPQIMTKAHTSGSFAELVCSNSFRGQDLTNAVGLLKEELKLSGSLIMEAALASQIPAGGALAVDRQRFSEYVDEKIRNNPLLNVHQQEVTEIPETTQQTPTILAPGPLASKSLTDAITKFTGKQNLAFFDAISPIIIDHTIDHQICFLGSRYDKGSSADYLNIPLTQEQYQCFYQDILNAEKHQAHAEVESDLLETLRPFEGCMPIEDIAARGQDTLLFGPLKPVGLTDPRTGNRPYAVVQLRHDDKQGKLWNMVGMQTRMKHSEQLRVLRSLPGLQEAEFVRLGSVHRNTFIDSPKCLEPTLEFKNQEGLFIAGQISGTEGYVESTAGGLVAGINAARRLRNQPLLVFPETTAIGSLLAYISDPSRTDFQPINISYGLMNSYLNAPTRKPNGRKIPKKDRRIQAAQTALQHIEEFIQSIDA